VPDNLRTTVSKADRYEPVLNPAYARMAEHYGTAIIPARIKRPRDKPVVEGSVRFVANQVAAVLRDRRLVGLPELILTDTIVDRITTNAHATVLTGDDSMRKPFNQLY
jgi:transposase